MAINLTEKAASEVKRVLDEQKLEEGMFLRIGVAGGGCSGFNYTLGFDKEFDDKMDTRLDCHGVDVVIDHVGQATMEGTRMPPSAWVPLKSRNGTVLTCAQPGPYSANEPLRPM